MNVGTAVGNVVELRTLISESSSSFKCFVFMNVGWLCIECGILTPSNVELNPICHLLALLGAHHILHVSSVRVNGLVST